MAQKIKFKDLNWPLKVLIIIGAFTGTLDLLDFFINFVKGFLGI